MRRGRTLMQAAAPASSGTVATDFFVLAKDRTARKDPLENLNTYTGGWDVTSKNYWASLVYTGLPAAILAAVWLLLGLAMLLLVCCCCCCCCENLRGSHAGGILVPLAFLVLFTGAAVLGSVLVYIYQAKTNEELNSALDYVVERSDVVVVSLRNTSAYLNDSRSLATITYAVPASQQAKLAELSSQLNNASSTLEQETHGNAKRIRDGLDVVRLVMIVTAGVMLLLVLLGFLFSTLGVTCLLYTLIVLVWYLIAITWVLCGVYIVLNNLVGDTCVAMGEWAANPSANTTLKEILPCVDINTTDAALAQTRAIVNDTINGINSDVQKLINNDNNNGSELLPLICNPLDPSFTIAGCVNASNAATAWLPYVCPSNTTSPSTGCKLAGKLNTTIYSELNKTISVLTGLSDNIPFLADLANCKFVRDAVTVIRQEHCDDLQSYLKWQYIGLAIISAGFMLSVLLWVIVSRKRKHRFSDGPEKPYGEE